MSNGNNLNYLQPEIKWIMDNRGLKAKRFCSILLGGRCGDWEEVNGWDVSLPEGKPEPQDPVLPANGSVSYKVLHLSDIHLDLSYKVGATSVCDLPMGCSNHTAMTDDPAKAACPHAAGRGARVRPQRASTRVPCVVSCGCRHTARPATRPSHAVMLYSRNSETAQTPTSQ